MPCRNRKNAAKVPQLDVAGVAVLAVIVVIESDRYEVIGYPEDFTHGPFALPMLLPFHSL